jgi:3-deoxy-manno-octulosonate cytidylyltransferase (CMP-KDO synthetase)
VLATGTKTQHGPANIHQPQWHCPGIREAPSRMNPIIIIPARMASTRLKHKPLADIHGKPMIQHVFERAVAANVGPVVVAAGDPEICAVIHGLGGTCVLTDPALPRGSDRIFTALKEIDREHRFDVVINMQGDQPTTAPGLLTDVLQCLADPEVDVGTLVVPLTQKVDDPNIVKVVLGRLSGKRGRCLYFSRQPVPHRGPYFYHLGFYAYRRTALDAYARLPQSELELSEDLEQLRLLEAGYRYDAAIVEAAPLSVDTPADLEEARRVLAGRGRPPQAQLR